MTDQQIKHLEIIQDVVRRRAQNSFAYKGWSIILVPAIFALASKQASPAYLLVAVIPTVVFWGLDGYYLRQERLFRQLYDAVRTQSAADLETDPLSMDTSPHSDQVATWLGTCMSRTVVWLYAPLAVVILAVAGFAYSLS